ncbi:MAG: hypothetical protein GX575_00190 [Candidatus Anammoximicrobium sp.]|nr:hypothetical protein [Candidatus Anammoximicrobium sp.]
MTTATATSRNGVALTGTIPRSIAVDYVVDGPRTAAAVASGRSMLQAVVMVTPDGEVHTAHHAQNPALHLLRAPHRGYCDAVFGRAVEMKFGLAPPADFDDVRAMLVLLGDEDPNDPIVSLDAAAEMAQYMAASLDRLRARIQAEGLAYVYRQIELPVVQPTADMILNGVGVDTQVLAQLIADSTRQMAHGREQLRQLSGRHINPASAEDLGSYLFGELGLPVVEWTGNGNPSTDKLALRQLEDLHPAIPMVQAYRRSEAIHNVAQALSHARSSVTGRIHPHLDPLGASTGRFSCSLPNLQGLPNEVRRAITADPGHMLIELDIAHAELRVLAQMSQDPELLRVFQQDRDVHRETAAALLAIDAERVSREQRNDIGKRFNFGVSYGQTAYGVAKQLGASLSEAQDCIERYFRRFQGVRAWIQAIQQAARWTGLPRTLYGRQRRVDPLAAEDDAGHYLRQAINGPVQGTAADLIKMATARVHRALPADCRLLLCVHDSLLVQAPTERAEEVASELRRVMECPPPGFTVPIKVEVKIGPTWGRCVSGK